MTSTTPEHVIKFPSAYAPAKIVSVKKPSKKSHIDLKGRREYYLAFIKVWDELRVTYGADFNNDIHPIAAAQIELAMIDDMLAESRDE